MRELQQKTMDKQGKKQKQKAERYVIHEQVSDVNNPVNTNCNRNTVLPGSESGRNSRSEETIYKCAVEKRNSSSSEEEPIDTSGDSVINNMIDNLLVSECEKGATLNRKKTDINRQSILVDPQPGTSRRVEEDMEYEETYYQDQDQEPELRSPEDRARQMVRDAERAKAKIFATSGKNDLRLDVNNQYVHSAMVDESYLVVGAHLEDNTITKITNGEYIDFGKLLPKDRILAEEDGRMNLVIKGGQSYWTPVSDAVHINSFSKWEQAFRVFSNIYTKAHPHRSSELIQYNHIIHTISQTYSWDNVYLYDLYGCIWVETLAEAGL